MQKSNRKYPAVLLFILIMGIIGFKDVGIFVNSYNTISEGVELNYVSNDRIRVLGEDESSYNVQDGNYSFQVPKKDLLRVHNGVKGYMVSKNTPIYNEETGSVNRLLFIDEYLEFIEDRGEQALVKSKDNIKGLVYKKDLAEDKKRNIVEGQILEDTNTSNSSGQSIQLKAGDKVDVAWFEKDYFIIFDKDNNKFNINKELIDIEPVDNNPVDNTYLTSDNELLDELVARSKTYLGRPYVWGDTGKKGFDCSGLIYRVYQDIADTKLPRTSRDMANAGVRVSVDNLQPGDLLFFNSGGSSGISHVSMYIGNGDMIHASNMQQAIVIDPISGSYFQNNFVNAQRIIN